jgi:hypothetical protein
MPPTAFICRSDRRSPQPPPWICLDLAPYVEGLQSQLEDVFSVAAAAFFPAVPAVAPLPPRSTAELRMAMGGAEGTLRRRRRRERRERWSPNHNHARTGSGRRRVGQMSRTTLLEPPPPPRSTGLARRLVRRRDLRLQATTGCFLQKQ